MEGDREEIRQEYADRFLREREEHVSESSDSSDSDEQPADVLFEQVPDLISEDEENSRTITVSDDDIPELFNPPSLTANLISSARSTDAILKRQIDLCNQQ